VEQKQGNESTNLKQMNSIFYTNVILLVTPMHIVRNGRQHILYFIIQHFFYLRRQIALTGYFFCYRLPHN